MLNRGWQRLRGTFSVAQTAFVAMATVVGTAAGLDQGLSLWQIVVILIAMAAGDMAVCRDRPLGPSAVMRMPVRPPTRWP